MPIDPDTLKALDLATQPFDKVVDLAHAWRILARQEKARADRLEARVCATCRLWGGDPDSPALGRCSVSGSFRIRVISEATVPVRTELWTEPDWGCRHHAVRGRTR